jgi:hypothetical protein
MRWSGVQIMCSFMKFAGTQLIGILSFIRFSYLTVCIIILLSYQKGEELGLYLIYIYFHPPSTHKPTHTHIMLNGASIQIEKWLGMICLLGKRMIYLSIYLIYI